MNHAVFKKTLKNVRKHRNIKVVTTEKRRNCLVSKPNYYITKLFTENLLAMGMKKTQILMNKPVFPGLSILGQSKTAMYEFWYEFWYSYKKWNILVLMSQSLNDFHHISQTENFL